MFAKVLWDWFLVYCMNVQLSIFRCSSPAPAGEGQARRVASRLGARGQHGIQLLQRTVGQSVRARAAVSVGIRFLAVPQRGPARGLCLATARPTGPGSRGKIPAPAPRTSKD